MDENKEMIIDDAMHDFPGPTPEQEEEWERERIAAHEAEIKPFRDLKSQINDHDELMADTLYELTMLEFGMEV